MADDARMIAPDDRLQLHSSGGSAVPSHAAAPNPARRAGVRRAISQPRLRRVMRQLHLWVGLVIGVLFTALGISGSVLVFQPELLRWQYPQLFAEPAPTEAAIARGLEQLLASPPAGVTGGDLPRATAPYWQLYTTDGRRLYLDAAAERELLVRSPGNDAVLFLRDLHTHLLGGHRGEQLLGVVGLMCLFLLLSGLYLWWPRGGTLSAHLRWYSGPPIRRWISWHRSCGTLTLPLLLLVTLTGVGMVYSGAARSVLAVALDDAPDPAAPLTIPRVPTGSAGSAAAADRASRQDRADASGHALQLLQTARAMLPEATLARFSLPAADDARLMFRARSPGEWHPFGRSLLWLDRDRAAPLSASDATRLAAAARASHAIYPLHGGSVGGWPYRLAVALSGLLPPFLLVTGALLWWRRRGG